MYKKKKVILLSSAGSASPAVPWSAVPLISHTPMYVTSLVYSWYSIHIKFSIILTTQRACLNAGLNGKNALKIFFLQWISTMRHARKCALLLNYIGSSAFDIFATDIDDDKEYKKAMDHLTEHEMFREICPTGPLPLPHH